MHPSTYYFCFEPPDLILFLWEFEEEIMRTGMHDQFLLGRGDNFLIKSGSSKQK